MPFKSVIHAQNRLRNDETPLAEAEVPDFFPCLPHLGEGDVRILWGHLALLTMQALHQNRAAIERFEKSSSRWTRWVTVLTVVLVIETTVLAWLTWKM